VHRAAPCRSVPVTSTLDLTREPKRRIQRSRDPHKSVGCPRWPCIAGVGGHSGVLGERAHRDGLVANVVGLGGVRLVVRAEDLELARTILALRDSGELEAALVEEFPPDALRCKRCGSEGVVERRSWLEIAFAFVLLFTCRASYPPARDLRCNSCGELSW